MDFDQIYTTYWQRIFRVCMGYVNNHSLAQDLTQETFITVWKQLGKFRNESNIGTWIFRIASNTCLRHIEVEGRIKKTSLVIDVKEEKAISIEPQIQFLYQCISELKEIDRIVISLELEEINQAEIAKIVGLSEVNVRVKIHRIKEKLMQKFKEHGNQY
ncbi:RNA polymerase sigma factor [Galbibacter sp.]|jgi:RNA polymerase sigma-70 factor (ECF subfamily)|uniref:RNA polymerase sigma factor n=1 Tax=Galbibacter sp. TaxID=2918471 RepID=UPI003A91E062